jgi:hypothetical protein
MNMKDGFPLYIFLSCYPNLLGHDNGRLRGVTKQKYVGLEAGKKMIKSVIFPVG